MEIIAIIPRPSEQGGVDTTFIYRKGQKNWMKKKNTFCFRLKKIWRTMTEARYRRGSRLNTLDCSSSRREEVGVSWRRTPSAIGSLRAWPGSWEHIVNKPSLKPLSTNSHSLAPLVGLELCLPVSHIVTQCDILTSVPIEHARYELIALQREWCGSGSHCRRCSHHLAGCARYAT